MIFGDLIGQAFRDISGMPPKVSSFNSRLKIYDDISNDISEVRRLVINYFEETRDINWSLVEAKKKKIDFELKNGTILENDYVWQSNLLDEECENIIDDFVSSTDSYFVKAYRNKLYSVKDRHKKDPYISSMEFDSWFQMKGAKEIAELASLQIRCSDEYVDAKKIAEIYEKYRMRKHMRRGR